MRPHLTTLNCGLGRDSIAMLCLLAERRLMVDGEHVGPEAVDAVIFADTGIDVDAVLRRVADEHELVLPRLRIATPDTP